MAWLILAALHTICWDASPTATSYTVYLSAEPCREPIVMATVPDTGEPRVCALMAFGNPAPGRCYFYLVTASNVAGMSLNGHEALCP